MTPQNDTADDPRASNQQYITQNQVFHYPPAHCDPPQLTRTIYGPLPSLSLLIPFQGTFNSFCSLLMLIRHRTDPPSWTPSKTQAPNTINCAQPRVTNKAPPASYSHRKFKLGPSNDPFYIHRLQPPLHRYERNRLGIDPGRCSRVYNGLPYNPSQKVSKSSMIARSLHIHSEEEISAAYGLLLLPKATVVFEEDSLRHPGYLDASETQKGTVVYTANNANYKGKHFHP
jgi:hypothetical protein